VTQLSSQKGTQNKGIKL